MRSRAQGFLAALVVAAGSLFYVPAQAQNTGTVTLAELPREARTTLALIRQDGPFPYPRDGIVFGNFEKRLPREPRGFYREYTVPTPGERTRGARRIISGGDPPRVFYYTGDHYQSFRQIAE